MRKLILIAALIMISATGRVYAQASGYIEGMLAAQNLSKADITFNAFPSLIRIRDFVELKQGRMILELSGVDDYQNFYNLDSLLTMFRDDIAFYKDSLNNDPTGNMRIDYAMNTDYTFKKIRVKKYPPAGKMFLNKNGNISRLKFEQDTVRILIGKSKPGISYGRKAPCTISYAIQATFLLDNYYDVDKVVASHELRRIIGTLEKKSHSRIDDKRTFARPLTIKYNPYYAGKNIYVVHNMLMQNEYIPRKWYFRKFDANFYMGAGLVRSNVATMAELGIQWNNYVGMTTPGQFRDRDIVRLSVAPYLFFEKNAQGDYVTKDNWFVNVSTGSIYEVNAKTWMGKEATFGVGYLAINNGSYFKHTTLKMFTDLQVLSRLTIVPEIIFTDNFKQIFPGFTLKVF